MDSTIARYVADLDSDSGETAEDAQHGLTALGPRVLDAVIAAVPHLGRFGRLCAIEIFTALGDPRPADVLIELLSSDSSTVREWAAEALAELGVQRAVPALWQAYEHFRRQGEDPDHSEGMGYRWALTHLGARDDGVPPRAAALRVVAGNLTNAWPTSHLVDVIEDFAAHGQAVLYFQLWRVKPDGGVYGERRPDVDWHIDRQQPWDRIVAHCRDWAVLVAEAVDASPDLVATLSWISAADL